MPAKVDGEASAHTSFTNEQVLDPNFADTLAGVVAVMMPFVHTLNDYIAPP